MDPSEGDFIDCVRTRLERRYGRSLSVGQELLMGRFEAHQSLRALKDAAEDIALALEAPQVVGAGLAFEDIIRPGLGEARILLEPLQQIHAKSANAHAGHEGRVL